MLIRASSERHFIMYEALRKGATIEEIHKITIKMNTSSADERTGRPEEENPGLQRKEAFLLMNADCQAKKDGFSDKYLASFWKNPGGRYSNAENLLEHEERWDAVHVSGVKDLLLTTTPLTMRRIKILFPTAA